MLERAGVRVVPREPVTVVIETQSSRPLAFGAVADISETGACVWTLEPGLSVGDRLVLLLHFAGEGSPLQAAGCVVWTGPDSLHRGAARYGFQWAATSGPQHGRLKRLIRSSRTGH